jgi:two-component system response regulator HydG
VKPPQSSSDRVIERPHLTELLEFRPDQGIIRLHEQRVVILSAAAMGLLRKELIETLGFETTRRIFLRFGFADGYHDAVSLRDRSKWNTPLEGLRAGSELHRLEGIVRADISKVEHDPASGRFEEEVTWYDSYVAEQHLHHYGRSDTPVCWSLAGYASGYASACLGQEIYFRETACLAEGASACSVVGKDATSWGDALEGLRADFHSADLGQEVERIREAAHRRLQDLDRRERVVEKRERELNLLRERVARHAASKHFIAALPRCRKCSNWPRALRRSIPPC